MARSRPRDAQPLAIAVAVGVALVVAFSVPRKLNFARGWIEQRALEATGQALPLRGRRLARRHAAQRTRRGRHADEADRCRRARAGAGPVARRDPPHRGPADDQRDAAKAKAAGAPAQATAASAPDPARRVLPQQRFDSTRWNTLDVDVQFKGAAVRNVGSFPLDDLGFGLFLQDRRLRIESLSLKAGAGTVSGRLAIDGAAQPMGAQLDARWRGLKLDELLPKLQATRSARGTLNGRAKLSAQGNSSNCWTSTPSSAAA